MATGGIGNLRPRSPDRFRLVDSRRVRGVAVNVDDARLDAARPARSQAGESLSPRPHRDTARAGSRWCCRPSRRLCTGRSTARQRECMSHPAPRAVRISHLGSNPLVQHRSVPEHPAGNGRVIDCQTTLGHHFLQISIAERIPQVPAHAQDDNFVPEMTSTEQRRSAITHPLHPTRRISPPLATLP